jgi:hypothetical protein
VAPIMFTTRTDNADNVRTTKLMASKSGLNVYLLVVDARKGRRPNHGANSGWKGILAAAVSVVLSLRL